jgi:hypothetical protein
MTDRVAQLEAALRAENALIVEAQRLLTAYIQGSQRGAAIGRRCPRAARDECCAIVCASAQNAARAGVRGVARRSKRVLSRLFRLKKKLPCQIFGLMGS